MRVRGADSAPVLAISVSVIIVPIVALTQAIVLLLVTIAAAVTLGLVAVPQAVWLSPDRSAQLDLSGEWRLADEGRGASVTIKPDGTIILDGWPRAVACVEGRTDSRMTEADLDWQNPTRLIGEVSSVGDATTLFTTFDPTKNVCTANQTFSIQVNFRDGRLRLLRFINGPDDEDQGIEPLVFYRDDRG